MSEIVMKVSNAGHDATDTNTRNILFDSQKATHPVLSTNDYLVDSATYTVPHGVGFAAKVWVNMVNAFNSTDDGRIPLEDSSIPQYDYKITRYNWSTDRGAATNKTVRVIVFAKSIDSVDL